MSFSNGPRSLRLPLGVRSLLFEGAERLRRSENAIVASLSACGYREIILPVLDYAEPYSRLAGTDADRVYSFLDRDGERLGLRADFTPMMARHLAPRLAALEKPVLVFYRGDVIRYEPPRAGRRREFFQIGAERIGDASLEADREIFADLLSAIHSELPSESLVVFQAARFLDRVLESSGVDEPRRREIRLALVARSRSRLSVAASPASEEVRRFLECQLVGELDLASPLLASHDRPLLDLLADLGEMARARGLEVAFDLAEAAEHSYYTGVSFSIVPAGRTVAVASGGRYDGLFALFGAEAHAVGFTIGLERLSGEGIG